MAVIPEWSGRGSKEDLQVRRYHPDPARAARYEIKVWLTWHPKIQHYAILDDAESILPEQRANLFQTTWESGLTEDIALAVEKHLNEETIDNFADRFSTLEPIGAGRSPLIRPRDKASLPMPVNGL